MPPVRSRKQVRPMPVGGGARGRGPGHEAVQTPRLLQLLRQGLACACLALRCQPPTRPPSLTTHHACTRRTRGCRYSTSALLRWRRRGRSPSAPRRWHPPRRRRSRAPSAPPFGQQQRPPGLFRQPRRPPPLRSCSGQAGWGMAVGAGRAGWAAQPVGLASGRGVASHASRAGLGGQNAGQTGLGRAGSWGAVNCALAPPRGTVGDGRPRPLPPPLPFQNKGRC